MLAGMMVAALGLGVAHASDVRDTGKLFSDAGAQDARQKLQAIEDTTGVETIIVTAAEADQKTFASDHAKNKFFGEWLMREAKDAKAKGVIILLCKSPGRVQVDFHKDLFAKGWPKSEPAAIRDRALPALKAKDFDKALGSFVASVETLSRRPAATPVRAAEAPAAAQAEKLNDPKTWDAKTIALVIGGVVMLLIVVLAISNRARERVVYQGGGTGSSTGYSGSSGYAPRPTTPRPSYEPQPVYSPPVQAPSVGGGGLGNLGSAALGAAAGYAIGSHRSHADEPRHHRESSSSHESYSPPVYDSPSAPSDSGGGGFDFGGGGGGDFSGGSGGDF